MFARYSTAARFGARRELAGVHHLLANTSHEPGLSVQYTRNGFAENASFADHAGHRINNLRGISVI
jgi:hypothetical protein